VYHRKRAASDGAVGAIPAAPFAWEDETMGFNLNKWLREQVDAVKGIRAIELFIDNTLIIDGQHRSSVRCPLWFWELT
jgi:hypothetical protein